MFIAEESVPSWAEPRTLKLAAGMKSCPGYPLTCGHVVAGANPRGQPNAEDGEWPGPGPGGRPEDGPMIKQGCQTQGLASRLRHWHDHDLRARA